MVCVTLHIIKCTLFQRKEELKVSLFYIVVPLLSEMVSGRKHEIPRIRDSSISLDFVNWLPHLYFLMFFFKKNIL